MLGKTMNTKPVIPKITDSPVTDSIETHPAYAQIRASRVWCGPTGQVLYGSDFRHTNYIIISICRSELNRSLSNDRPSPREEYIEVALSESQWATFVSSLNIGTVTPCTLARKDGKLVEDIAAPPDRTKQFQDELENRLEKAEALLQQLSAQISESNLTQKSKQVMQTTLIQAKNNLSANVGFVADQFTEHMETLTDRAKAEINAYVQSEIQRSGLEAITGKKILQLED